MNPVYLLTFDTDWCPSWMVDEVLDLLDKRGHQATLFSTGSLSPATAERIASVERIELGIHPNFLEEGAIQHPEHVIDTLLEELGPCTAIRTHGLFWWHGLGSLLSDRGFSCDSSLSAPGHLLSFPLRDNGIDRYPISWGDWSYLANPVSQEAVLKRISGFGRIRVFNFHPVHIAMNTSSLKQWQEYRQLIKTAPNRLKEIRDSGKTEWENGIRQLFLGILDQIKPGMSVTMSKAVEWL